MFVLDEVKSLTDAIFEQQGELQVPEPPPIWREKLAALEEANLFRQRASLIFDMRCWQLDTLGFQKIESSEMVKMIMGEAHTDEVDAKERQNYEWAYNHHKDEMLGNSWGGPPTIFKCIERKGPWYLPPFAKVEQWAVQFGKLDHLKREIPYGVVLKVEELKKLKLFNVFNVMAPMEAWERKTDIDPIVVGSVWELPPKEDGSNSSAGQTAHYFVAQW